MPQFTTLIRPDGALLFGYTVYLGLLVVLFRAQTVARAQTILVLLLIVVIATVNGPSGPRRPNLIHRKRIAGIDLRLTSGNNGFLYVLVRSAGRKN